MKKIDPDSLVPLNVFVEAYPIAIDVVYARAEHPDNHFPGLYHAEARIMWAEKNFAVVILAAAAICGALYKWTLELKDCLRTVEAQEGMARYNFHPLLVSKPGHGAHPRGMAIDIEPVDATGGKIPMGTPFDYLVGDPEKGDNPAARNYTKFSGTVAEQSEIWLNRNRLEFAMRKAATACGQTILPLPQEWWDFRLPPEVFGEFAPLREAEVRPYQRMIEPDVAGVQRILRGEYPEPVARVVAEVREMAAGVIEKLLAPS